MALARVSQRLPYVRPTWSEPGQCEAVMLNRVSRVFGQSLVSTRIGQTKNLILEMGHEVKKLSSDLTAEVNKVGISDPNHYAYSPLAKTLRERRDRVECSIGILTNKLAEYEASLATSVEEQNHVTAPRVRKKIYWRYHRFDGTLSRSPQSAGAIG